MNVLEKAIIFATNAHKGQKRKMSSTPYILHPLEVASIIATISSDLELMAAGCLHDVVEDCGVDPLTIREEFGSRVYSLVLSETEDKRINRPQTETWFERKEESLMILANTTDIDVKILWLADKLSNMRSFYREYLKIGDELWLHLHEHDKKKQEWYYRSILDNLAELKDSAAYQEYKELLDKVFGGK